LRFAKRYSNNTEAKKRYTPTATTVSLVPEKKQPKAILT